MKSKFKIEAVVLLMGIILLIFGWFFSMDRIIPVISGRLSEDGILSQYFIHALIYLRIIMFITSGVCFAWYALSIIMPGSIKNLSSVWGNKKAQILLLGMIVTLGIFLRFYGLGAKSLWLDEACTYVNLGSGSFTTMIKHCRQPAGVMPPLYFILTDIFIWIFGKSEIALRLTSAITGIFSIFMIYSISRVLFNYRVAAISSFFLAINGCLIAYSQEARPYSLAIFLSLLSYYFFLRMMDDNQNKYKIGYIVASILGMYSLYFFGMILSTQVIIFLIFKKRFKFTLVHFSILILILIVLYLPWLPITIYRLKMGVVNANWIGRPSILSFASIFKYFIFNGESGWGYQLFILLMVFGLFPSRKGNDKYNEQSIIQRAAIPILVIWFFLPLVVIFIISRVGLASIFLDRYLGLYSPPLLIICAFAVSKFKRAWIRLGLLWIVFVLSTFYLILFFNPAKKEDWRAAIHFIEDYSNENDIILVQTHEVATDIDYTTNQFTKTPLDFYYTGKLKIIGLPFTLDYEKFLIECSDFSQELKNHDRIWLIVRKAFERGQTPEFIEKYLNGFAIRRSMQHFKGVIVYKYEKSAQ